MMLIVGLAVDTARYQDLSTRMQPALDGASLAAAKLLSDPNLTRRDIRDAPATFFNAPVPTFGVRPSAISPLQITIDRANS